MTDLQDAMRAVSPDAIAVDVPEWDRKVYIAPLSAKEQIAIARLDVPAEEKTLRILLRSIVDENGVRLLGEDDWELLLSQPFPVLIPLVRASAHVNGVDEEEFKAAVTSFGKAQSERSLSE